MKMKETENSPRSEAVCPSKKGKLDLDAARDRIAGTNGPEYWRSLEELEVGALVAGDVPAFRIDHMPYGGIKDSGLGREGLRYAIEDMTEPKLLVMNLK